MAHGVHADSCSTTAHSSAGASAGADAAVRASAISAARSGTGGDVGVSFIERRCARRVQQNEMTPRAERLVRPSLACADVYSSFVAQGGSIALGTFSKMRIARSHKMT